MVCVYMDVCVGGGGGEFVMRRSSMQMHKDAHSQSYACCCSGVCSKRTDIHARRAEQVHCMWRRRHVLSPTAALVPSRVGSTTSSIAHQAARQH